MSDDKLEMGHDSANHIPTGYEDFPKEVVQMLMKSHPIKGKDYNEEEFNHEMARIAKRKKMEENKRQGVEVKENLPPRPPPPAPSPPLLPRRSPKSPLRR